MAVLADMLIALGLLLTTLGVVGIYRMPDVYTQLHASGKAAFLGTLAFLAAAAVAGQGAVDARAILIALFLVLTTPVSAHVIARASHARGEPLASPGATDESSRDPA
ncbi:MAG: monovalent cation/H(+) antiporter subunit G [Solirubrobacterales bacterium]